jgi:quercetin dioxygenase-like cupin family protein
MRAIAVVTSVLCIAVVAFFAGSSYGASQARSKVTNLLQASLSDRFTPDREVLVDLVEIPPNSQLDRHWHPGEEFHYYLEGDPEITIEGKGLTRPPLGSVGHVPFETLHRAGAGHSGARILVFRVHTKGQPWRYLDEEQLEDHDAVRR